MPFPRIFNLLNCIHIFHAFVNSSGDFDPPPILFLIPYENAIPAYRDRPWKWNFFVFLLSRMQYSSLWKIPPPGTFCYRKGHVRKVWRRSRFITKFPHIFWNPRNFHCSFQDNSFQKVEALPSLISDCMIMIWVYVYVTVESDCDGCKARPS